MVVYKRMSVAEVLAIVDKQVSVGMKDPVVVYLKNLLDAMHDGEGALESDEADTECKGAAGGHEGVSDRHAGADADAGAVADAGADAGADAEDSESDQAAPYSAASLHCCICCFHWISRRQTRPVAVLPMQSLLYFMLCITSVENKKCDKRVLNRLTTSIAEEPNNFWRCIFLEHELKAIELIARKRRQCMYEDRPFCIKREFALLYQAQNGNSLLLSGSNIANLLRNSRNEEPADNEGQAAGDDLGL